MNNSDDLCTPAPIRSTYHDETAMTELLDGFVDALPHRAAAIRDALAASDADVMKTMAHQLKGAAGGYGYPDVSDAAAAIESPLRSGEVDLNSLASKVDDLCELCERVIAGRGKA
ncbi:MAG: Hpt domain-containing protein [Planctomycetota bacterium]